MDSENAHRCGENVQNGFSFDFLQRYHKDSYQFLNHNIQVTGDETWVSPVNVETKEQL
jgi:hypothetical protein